MTLNGFQDRRFQPLSHLPLFSKSPLQKSLNDYNMEATPGFEPGDQGFADPCLTTWLCRLKFNTSASIEITKSNHILIWFNLQ